MNLLITGTASGIGQAVSEYFIERGHTVYGIDLIEPAPKENLRSFAADITDEAALLNVKAYLQENGITLIAAVMGGRWRNMAWTDLKRLFAYGMAVSEE